MDQEELIEAVESTIPPTNLNLIRVIKGEMWPKGLLCNNYGILINLEPNMVHIYQAKIQLQIGHLTNHMIVGKFIGHRLDNATQVTCLKSINAKFAPQSVVKLQQASKGFFYLHTKTHMSLHKILMSSPYEFEPGMCVMQQWEPWFNTHQKL